MGIIEVIPGAKFGTLTVKSREGNFNGETTWRCEDEKGRSVVFPESEIMAMYGETEEVVPDAEPETDNEDAKEEVVETEDDSTADPEAEAEEPGDESEAVVQDSDPDSDCDEVPGGAAVAQSEPEQEKEEAKEETPEPVTGKKKSFFSKKNKKK